MPTVFYTGRQFPLGQIFNTRDYCDINRKSMGEFSPEVAEVEEFIEGVRLEMVEETGNDLPQRLCSILVIPWPETQVTSKVAFKSERYRSGGWNVYGEMPDPPGLGEYCYYVIPKMNTKRLMVDERWIHALVESWPEIAGSPEAWQMARAYWSGHMWRIGASLMSFLFEGPVFVHSVCKTPVNVGA